MTASFVGLVPSSTMLESSLSKRIYCGRLEFTRRVLSRRSTSTVSGHKRRMTIIAAKADPEFEIPEEISNATWWDGVFARDIMTPDPMTVSPDTSVFTAMQTLDSMHISGLAVVDETGEVLGVVSAYDILALDCTPGQLDRSDGYFPPVDRCMNDFGGDRKAMWSAFLSLRKGIEKAQATKCGDSMHEAYCVSECASVTELADLVVRKHLHRVFVVNENSKIVGVVSLGDLLRVTMKKYREVNGTNQS